MHASPSKRLPQWARALAFLALPLWLCSAAAHAENGITLYGGWRGSSTLQDTVAQRDVRMRDSASGSVALDLSYDASRQIEFFISRQSTSLRVTPIGGTTTQKLPVTVTYAHVGGTNFFDGPIGQGPYVVGGLGLTVLSPGLDGFDTETRASLNVGLGYLLPLFREAAPGLALRIEGRAYFTLVNSSGGLFCSGGCTIAIKGDTFQQFEMLLGLSWRF
jgi:hypothetical protein